MYGLTSGKYTNPKYGIKIKPKIVNVIGTYVPRGQIEKCAALSNRQNTLVYYHENKLETIKFNMGCHKHYDAGVDYEIVIVDNGSEDEATQKYLGLLEKEGIKVFRRENIGFSFASFKYAWEKLGSDYDYFLFNEQDGVPSKDDWLLEILKKFHSEKDIGAVGNNVESFDLTEEYSELKQLCPYIGKRNATYNLDGHMTFTSSTILRQVDKIGGLFVLPLIGKKDREKNELIFQQPILELGYKITSFHDGNHICYANRNFLDEDPEYENIPKINITPMALAHTRLFVLKDYFGWYKGIYLKKLKNLIIYISPEKEFLGDAEDLVKKQIDNSLKLGWKVEDIVLVTNFPYEYRSVNSMVIDNHDQAPIAGIVFYLLNEDVVKEAELWWYHDLDVFQVHPMDSSLIDLEDTTAGFINTGNFFFRKGSNKLFEWIRNRALRLRSDEARALESLATENYRNINTKYKKLPKKRFHNENKK